MVRHFLEHLFLQLLLVPLVLLDLLSVLVLLGIRQHLEPLGLLADL